ncbi:MAG: glycosyltransferase family 2 protein [Verrucomicrobiota bacterium]|nr:glycosyltransferase family 2 protein [Verrucomicrobiota bacterium]
MDKENKKQRKLIIQIPCLNEAESLPVSLAALPRKVEGFTTVEWMILDDGSTDETIAVALEHGVDHVVKASTHQGLAKMFMLGLDACVKLGADVIVNTDADNQYCADDIPVLVKPIIEKKANIVVGERPIEEIEHFSLVKKFLQRFGTFVVRQLSGTEVRDATSGFRAISREAAVQLNVFNEYTYTLETIIQAGHKGIALVSVPIRTNPDLRSSKLVKSISSYVRKSLVTILRIYLIYRPALTFSRLSILPFIAGTGLTARWLYYFFFYYDVTRSRVPSLVVGISLLIATIFLFIFGVIAELISTNRKMLEETLARIRRIEGNNDKTDT